MAGARSIEARFGEHLADLLGRAGGPRRPTLVVAFSGGLDSTVLLHVLRFSTPGMEGRVSAAHLDHAMRVGSAGDAEWVRGLCAAWGVPVYSGRLGTPPATESEAREARYAFLHEARRGLMGDWVLTAHHGDDQAETVLFRAARGSGIPGLRGIRGVREDGVLRPLLPFFREELEGYADRMGLRWREDETNAHLGFARNALRHTILPSLESDVAPGARRSLAGLADQARIEEEAWSSVIPRLLEDVGVQEDVPEGAGEQRAFRVDRTGLTALHPGVQARLVRELARRLGEPLSAAGTQAALGFISSGTSGRSAPLGGGLVLRRDFETLTLTHSRGGDEGEASGGALVIHDPGPGEVEWPLPGGPRAVAWGRGAPPGAYAASGFVSLVLEPAALEFPLRLRPWAAGDRVRLSYGTKKLKKLLSEMRVPQGDRDRVIVLEDALGRILWVAGIARSAGASLPDTRDHGFYLALET